MWRFYFQKKKFKNDKKTVLKKTCLKPKGTKKKTKSCLALTQRQAKYEKEMKSEVIKWIDATRNFGRICYMLFGVRFCYFTRAHIGKIQRPQLACALRTPSSIAL